MSGRIGMQLRFHHDADLHACALLAVSRWRAGREEKRILGRIGDGVEKLRMMGNEEEYGFVIAAILLLGSEEDDL